MDTINSSTDRLGVSAAFLRMSFFPAHDPIQDATSLLSLSLLFVTFKLFEEHCSGVSRMLLSWVYLVFSHDQIEGLPFGQDYHRSDSGLSQGNGSMVHDIDRSLLLMFTLITW